MPDFYQDPPQLGNQYRDDAALRAVLARLLPEKVRQAIEAGLERLGQRVVGELPEYARDAEQNPPRHVPFDPWGRRVDRIETAPGWRMLDRVAAEEGIVATAYRRSEAEYSRLHQFARLYLYHPASAIYSCPLAMTDGAARLLELHGNAEQRKNLLPHLTSDDPAKFWTSGQWMTERTGGSDVSGTSTVARREAGVWRLYGDKWFTSATTAQLAMTLARIEENGVQDQGLSLFCLQLRDANGTLNGIRVNRLKDKLGTRALPTAELTLEGTRAEPVGERGRGVRTISTMLNITRLYNACCAAGYMRRGLALAHDYAGRRRVFGRLLAEQPLHRHTLERMDSEFRAALLLVFELARLLGREECGVADGQDRSFLRLLTPVAKLYTARQAIAVCSEALECFGGAGYVEDTGLPVLLRDAQVLSIWEGTTNVLSLDLLRVLGDDASLATLCEQLRVRLQAVQRQELREALPRAEELLATLERAAETLPRDPGQAQSLARQLAFALARALCAVLLLEQADWSLQAGHPDAAAACRAALVWCAADGMPLAKG